jgi:hypothetical protein
MTEMGSTSCYPLQVLRFQETYRCLKGFTQSVCYMSEGFHPVSLLYLSRSFSLDKSGSHDISGKLLNVMVSTLFMFLLK